MMTPRKACFQRTPAFVVDIECNNISLRLTDVTDDAGKNTNELEKCGPPLGEGSYYKIIE